MGLLTETNAQYYAGQQDLGILSNTLSNYRHGINSNSFANNISFWVFNFLKLKNNYLYSFVIFKNGFFWT